MATVSLAAAVPRCPLARPMAPQEQRLLIATEPKPTPGSRRWRQQGAQVTHPYPVEWAYKGAFSLLPGDFGPRVHAAPERLRAAVRWGRWCTPGTRPDLVSLRREGAELRGAGPGHRLHGSREFSPVARKRPPPSVYLIRPRLPYTWATSAWSTRLPGVGEVRKHTPPRRSQRIRMRNRAERKAPGGVIPVSRRKRCRL
jgi:hypothetical protein